MAVEPLFNQNRTQLLRKLRLSGAISPDAASAIDAAIQGVRVRIYDRLGEERVTTIKATTLTDNPTDSTGIIRLKAAVLEEKWVRYELMRSMPVIFHDSDGESLAAWNNEDFAIRGRGSDTKEAELERLQADIAELLAELVSGTDEPNIRASTIGPATTPVIRPLDTVQPWYLRERLG